MDASNIRCPVCGTQYQGDTLVDSCPVCDWVYDFSDDTPNEKTGANPVTLNEAKENFKQGKNIWGVPLK